MKQEENKIIIQINWEISQLFSAVNFMQSIKKIGESIFSLTSKIFSISFENQKKKIFTCQHVTTVNNSKVKT